MSSSGRARPVDPPDRTAGRVERAAVRAADGGPQAGSNGFASLQRAAGNRAVTTAIARIRAASAPAGQAGGRPVVQRDAAADAVAAAHGRRYGDASAAISGAGWLSRDDVSLAVMRDLRITELITMSKVPAGAALLRQLRDELRGGWTSGDEETKAGIIDALLGDTMARARYNRRQILAIRAAAASDLDALATMFASDELIDDGTVPGRFTVVLDATEHLLIPGLQTGVRFGDTGFRGDQKPGGEGFRDPHPESRNQVGHFLTAVGLQLHPEVVSRRIPYFGSIRQMVAAPAGMPDRDVALRLTIGHEKAPDPDGEEAMQRIMVAVALEGLMPGAAVDQTGREVRAVIAAFRRQFQAATDEDVRAWNDAKAAAGDGGRLDMAAAEPLLRRVAINPAQRGNSIQDLRLSMVGWRLAERVAAGRFTTRAEVAGWLRTNLGP